MAGGQTHAVVSPQMHCSTPAPAGMRPASPVLGAGDPVGPTGTALALGAPGVWGGSMMVNKTVGECTRQGLHHHP